MIYKTLHRKLKIEQHELMCSGKISSSCSISGTRRATRVTNPMVSHECDYDKRKISVVICDTDIPVRWRSQNF